MFTILLDNLPLPALPRSAEQLVKKPVTNAERYINHLHSILIRYGPRVVVGLIFLLLGWWIINLIVRALGHIMKIRDVDPTLRPFLRSVTSISLKMLLILSASSMMGIETTSFMAALGAAGLAVGLALQGSLSNFAGGVLILLFKPFRVGDFIGARGYEGTVKEIQILYTIMVTVDNKKVVIPNGNLSNNDVVNFTAHDNRRIDLKIGINPGSDLMKAKEVLVAATQADYRILKEPSPTVGVESLVDNAVIFNCFVWVKRTDLGDVKHDLLERIKLEFDKAGIQLPLTAVPEKK
jgi:small conductance mechanosensitive channel